MQLASLRLQSRFVDRVAEQRVNEFQVDAVEPCQRSFGQRRRVVLVIVEHVAQSGQRCAMSENSGGLQSRVIASGQASGTRQHDRPHRSRQQLVPRASCAEQLIEK